MSSDEFYIGYAGGKTPGLSAFSRRVTLGVLALVLVVGGLLVTSMGEFSNAVFEFGVEREFEGTIAEGIVPILDVQRPGASADEAETSSYLLVAFGKFGARDLVSDLQGHRVKLRGSLIYRDDQTMIEVVDGSLEDLGVVEGARSVAEVEEGTQTLVGEIVDSKCFLGVMKPGNLKPHRACAVRCISGGVPPVLLVRGADGLASYYLLLGEEGEAVNREVLSVVAEPVTVQGRVVRRGDLRFVYADPATYVR